MFSRPLHGLRGLATFMVLCAHVSFGFYDHFYHDDPLLAAVMPRLANLGTYGVELFFVISGYVITQSCLKYSPGEFAGRRFMRIYPVFALFTLFYFLANRALHIAPDRGSTTDLLANLFFLDIFAGTQALSPNAWSITLEVWYYICTYLVIDAFIRRRDTFHPVRALCAVALSLLVLTAYDITAYFIGGVVLYFMASKMERPLAPRRNLPFVLALGAILIIATFFDFDPRSYFSQTGLQLIALALLAATLVAVHDVLDERNPLARLLMSRPFTFLGTISYSLYLTHPYVYMALRMAGHRLHVERLPWALTMPVYLVLALGLSLAGGWVVHRLVETVPYRLAYRNRIYRAA
ncbi:peptidoglycan/LPS O-acetylase OafA/YrhL [Novosphingobium sp. SG751A]|uniref:acyltransferase family protein n=1 Tax=Novosphingobium sp. SG751A TaxID=2587000 RepID=UPI0015527AD4|nr:acyltransferase [Novosphingobium sp. SG751A]NOW47691.1 peptidoglycan/LPS O-acetylase OafA/YrhL [Novosphingobium sp. SG751A]